MKRILVTAAAVLLTSCVSQADLQAALAKNRQLEQQGTERAAQAATEDAQLASLRKQQATLKQELADSQADLATANKEAKRLKAQLSGLVCDQQIDDMKYVNVLDASTIMAGWWARQPNVERVQGTYRDKIWSNALTEIHGIRYIGAEDHKPYVEHFLIFFDEFGMKQGVFWIGGQCWLDTP